MIKQWSATTILIHLAIWALVTHFLFDVEGLYYSIHDLISNKGEKIDDVIFFPLTIVLFYFNAYYLVPHYLNKNSWPKYLGLLVLTFMFVIGTILGFYFLLTALGYEFYMDKIDIIDAAVFTSVLFAAVSTSIGVAKLTVLKDQQKQKAEQDQKTAEIKFLNAQVNPHFLFNSLNSIYSLAAEEQASQTMESVLKLSEIMRYPLNEGTKASVSLTSEVDFISNFIELQKLRLGKDYPIKFDVQGNTNSFQIAPLLLIPFVENAFKYGVSHRQPSMISISINCYKNTLSFNCTNKIVKEEQVSSHELGLRNVQSRLELLYKDAYTLSMDAQNEYTVQLRIEIPE